VRFSPEAPLTLGSPTRVTAYGQQYEFDGFYLLAGQDLFGKHGLCMPRVQFTCGGEVATAELESVEFPTALLPQEERVALGDLHALLYSSLLQLPDFLPSQAAEGGNPCRPVHVFPRFVLASRRRCRSEMEAEGVMGEGEKIDRVQADKCPDELGAAMLVELLRAPQPSVLEWLCAQRKHLGGVGSFHADGSVGGEEDESEAVAVAFKNVPPDTTVEALTEYLRPYRLVPRSLALYPHPSTRGKPVLQGTAQCIDQAAAVELRSTRHRVGRQG
jgi:hypothetical protein